MKIEVKKEEKKEFDFPCLMEDKEGLGYLILMIEKSKGFALKHPAEKVGYFSEVWDMFAFKPFNGTIKLSNE